MHPDPYQTVELSRAEFDSLPEYSTTTPTGVAAGKRWKCCLPCGCWLLGAYVEHPDPSKVIERWRRIVIAPAPVAPLTFDRFQKANAERCVEFKHTTGAWSLLEWAGAAAGEMGEAANVCKKLKRKEQGGGGKWGAKDPDEATLRANLAEEIGDVLAYLALLATAAGLNLERCATEKFDRVSDVIEWEGERLLGGPQKKEA